MVVQECYLIPKFYREHVINLVDPITIGKIGTDNPVVTFNRAAVGPTTPAIDGVVGSFADPNSPNLLSTRYLRVYDLIELAGQNTTGGWHSYHQHGEAMQPLKIK